MIDIKELPIGSIGVSDSNRFIVLAKDTNTVTVYSEKEGFTMKIETKKLFVQLLFQPDKTVNSFTEFSYERCFEEMLLLVEKAEVCLGKSK